MPAEDIPQKQWPWFCEGFSHQHAGWLADVQLSCPDAGRVQQLATGAWLHSVKYEPENARIVVKLDREALPPLTPSLYRPKRITLERDAQGAHTGVDFESESGEELLLQFPVTVPMEMLNGAEGAM